MPMVSESDAYNLATLYMRRSGAPRSQQAFSSVVNSIMSGEVPNEIRQEYDQAFAASYDESERNRPQALESFRQSMPNGSAPNNNESRSRSMNAPMPTARPSQTIENPVGQSTAGPGYAGDPASDPIDVNESSGDMTDVLPIAVPGVLAAQQAARSTGEQRRGSRTTSQLATAANAGNQTNTSRSAPLEGEVLGPERSQATAIPDQRNTSVGRARPADPNMRIVPGESVTPPPPAGPAAQIGMDAPMPDAGSAPIDPFSQSSVRIELMPTPDGQARPVLQVELPNFGLVSITPDGEVLAADGKPLQGIVPPGLEEAIAGAGQAEQRVYSMFQNARRTQPRFRF